jgi:sterol desaturase/sphingolipid hydroxylase (fatty acid hydroxylase superfamily)
MIEVDDRQGIASRIRQFSAASGSVVAAIAESRLNYWASYVTDFSCPLLFAWLGIRHGQTWPSMVISATFGLAVFTLVEYSIHRFLLHNPKSSLYHLHEAHHKHPENPSAFLFPTSVVVLMLVWCLFTYGFHIHSASFFLAGLSAGYCYFGALHHFEHTTRINQIPFRWLQGRWAAHSVHHHIEETNFGVMTSFWDYVFGTHQKQRKRRQQSA